MLKLKWNVELEEHALILEYEDAIHGYNQISGHSIIGNKSNSQPLYASIRHHMPLLPHYSICPGDLFSKL
jgi:hypothetical protein